jgi:hypothetical protein
VIDAVHPPPSSADLDGLAELLADAVAGGASVSFMTRVRAASSGITAIAQGQPVQLA